MLCDRCKQREATVHKEVVINGVGRSEHLCSECAAKEDGRWLNDFDSFFGNDFWGNQMLGQWFQPFFEGLAAPSPSQKKVDTCPHCGMTWDEFQKNGLLGCSECYDHFADALPPLLKKLHADHEQKSGAKQNASSETNTNVDHLSTKEKMQAELNQAIAEENFEEAARLRDQLKSLHEEDK